MKGKCDFSHEIMTEVAPTTLKKEYQCIDLVKPMHRRVRGNALREVPQCIASQASSAQLAASPRVRRVSFR